MSKNQEQDLQEKVLPGAMHNWWIQTFQKALRVVQVSVETSLGYHWVDQCRKRANFPLTYLSQVLRVKFSQYKTTNHRWLLKETHPIPTHSQPFHFQTKPCLKNWWVQTGNSRQSHWTNKTNPQEMLFRNILIVSPTWWKRRILIWEECQVDSQSIRLMRDSWGKKLMSL